MYHTQMCVTQERLFAITHLYGGLAFPNAQVLLGISWTGVSTPVEGEI